ncbi:MAG TPA: hypothetical protein VK497_01630 [Candidatus Saccharimonadales bacterium]|nr:hypothetical protein [Candidatus Saccharimonadales bacterium]
MQPDRDPQQWQQPSEQPSQAPYQTVADETPRPVVTLTPDQSVASVAPEAADTQPEVTQPAATPTEQVLAPDENPVHWQATEYIHRHKGTLWFVVFGIVVVIAIVLAIFLMQSITFAILVPVMAAALIVYSHRPPRVLDYTLSRQGLHVNDRLYSFAEFKGFGVIRDGEEYSIMLIPTKRFKPGVYVYFPEEAGEAIVDMLAARLPMQELHMDFVDRIIRKLRI